MTFIFIEKLVLWVSRSTFLLLYFLFEKLLHCSTSIKKHNCFALKLVFGIQNVQAGDFVNLSSCLP